MQAHRRKLPPSDIRPAGGALIWLAVSLVVLATLPGMMSGNFLPKTFWAVFTVGIGLVLLPPLKDVSFRLTLLGAVWLVYLAWALLSLAWAPAFRPGFERWLVLLVLTFAYLLARRTRFWESELFWLALSILITLVSVIGILQYFLPAFPLVNSFPGTAVPRATLGHRNYASMYLMVTFPFVLGYFFRRRGWAAVVPLVALVLSLSFILLARNRGAWVGLLAGLFYLAAAGGGRYVIPRIKRLAILVLPALLTILAVYRVGPPAGAERSFRRKVDLGHTARSLLDPQQRLSFWRPTLGITDPLLGAGFGNFPVVATPLDREGQVKTLNWEVHNDYLQAYVDLGVPGVLIFALFFFLLIRLAWKGRMRVVYLAAGASVVGIAVMQFTTFTSEKVSTQIWLAGVVALLNSLPGEKPVWRINIPAPLGRAGNYLASGGLLLFALAVGYTIRGDLVLRKESLEINKVLQLQQVIDNPDQYSLSVLDYARKELPGSWIKAGIRLNRLADRVIPSMLFDANMRHISLHQLAGMAVRLGHYDAAEELSRRALVLHPADRTSLMFLAEIALRRQDLDRARDLLEEGLRTFGYNPHAPYFGQTLIRLYQHEGRNEEAAMIREKMARSLVAEPASPSPGDREPGVSPDGLILEWADCSAATSYDLFFWKAGEEEPEFPGRAGLRQSRGRPPGRLLPSTTYFWRVRAIGRYGEARGPIWFFRTEESPD